MKVSIKNLSRALTERARRAEARSDLESRLCRPHLARDLGLPPRAADHPVRRVLPW